MGSSECTTETPRTIRRRRTNKCHASCNSSVTVFVRFGGCEIIVSTNNSSTNHPFAYWGRQVQHANRLMREVCVLRLQGVTGRSFCGRATQANLQQLQGGICPAEENQCFRKNHQTAPPIAARPIRPKTNLKIAWPIFMARNSATTPTLPITNIRLLPFNCSKISIFVFS